MNAEKIDSLLFDHSDTLFIFKKDNGELYHVITKGRLQLQNLLHKRDCQMALLR